MGLFELNNDQITLSKEIQEIQLFKKLLKRENGSNIMAYIYHRCDFQSPYSSLLIEERKERVEEEVLEGDIDDEIEKACELYRELSKTPALELLEAAREGANALISYFKNANPAAEEKPGKEAKDLMSNLTKVGDLLNKFQEWEDTIKKEQDKADTRKGVTLNKYNQGDKT